MLNSLTLIGRLTETPTLKTIDGTYTVSTFVLAVQRPFKNREGEYDADFLRVTVWDVLAKNLCEYCQKGDMVAVTGRLQSKLAEFDFGNTQEDKKRVVMIEIIGERVVYLAKAQKNIKSEEDSSFYSEEQEFVPEN